MKLIKWVILVAFSLALMAPLAMAEEGDADLSRDEACAILGECGDEMVGVAEMMQAQCQSMIRVADKMKKKGMKIKMRGQVWQDQEMMAEGEALIQQAEDMEEQAKKMDEVCRIIIEQGKNKKKRSQQLRGDDSGGEYQHSAGDHN